VARARTSFVPDHFPPEPLLITFTLHSAFVEATEADTGEAAMWEEAVKLIKAGAVQAGHALEVERLQVRLDIGQINAMNNSAINYSARNGSPATIVAVAQVAPDPPSQIRGNLFA
jgi:hypothetical protein